MDLILWKELKTCKPKDCFLVASIHNLQKGKKWIQAVESAWAETNNLEAMIGQDKLGNLNRICNEDK